jgi:hypothetical protein
MSHALPCNDEEEHLARTNQVFLHRWWLNAFVQGALAEWTNLLFVSHLFVLGLSMGGS